ncbi:hypothetical protein [Hymenobacter baengnokdamensis]|uniref:hypothetical protein n=1 Tax=Hymenobacter baengnokdamensis TaxID=2615203 RepID=UPI001248CB68|nr:hypothetical protein [Hymenobacter baengnokdamensis]
MRTSILRISFLGGLLLLGCRMVGPQQAGRKAAGRANIISNKHILTESPTLEHPAPKPAPGP